MALSEERPVRRRFSAAVLTAALVAGAAGCGADAPDKAGGEPSSSPERTASETPSATPSPSYRPVRPKGAKVIRGTGYSFALPKGWVNLTRQMRADQPSIDVAVGAELQTDGFANNLSVTVAPTGAAVPESIDDIAAQILRELRPKAPKMRVRPDTTVAGLPAAKLSGTYNAGKQRYWLEQYVVVGPKRSHVISFSITPTTARKQRNALIDSVLRSWSFAR